MRDFPKTILFAVIATSIIFAASIFFLRSKTDQPPDHTNRRPGSVPKLNADNFNRNSSLEIASFAEVGHVDELVAKFAELDDDSFAPKYSGKWLDVVQHWMARDPASALELIACFPDEQQRAYAFDWSRAWYSQLPEDFLQFAKSNLSPSHVRSSWFKVMAETAKDRPEIAMQIILKCDQGDQKAVMTRSAFVTMGETDFKRALAQVSRLPFAEDKSIAISSLASTVKSTDLNLITNNDFIQLPEDLKKVLGEATVGSIARQDGVEGVLKLYRENPDLRTYGAGAVKVIASADWHQFYDQINQFVQDGLIDYSRDSEVIATGIAEYLNPEKSIDFLKSIPDEEKGSAGRAIVKQLSNSPRNDYLFELLGNIPPGTSRNYAAEPFMNFLQGDSSQNVEKIKKLQSILTQP